VKYLNKFRPIKKIGYIILLVCLAVGSVGCGRKETDTDTVEVDQEDTKLEIRNLQEGYFGVHDIMFPVPYRMDSTNSDYNPDEMRFHAYMPTQFRGWMDENDDCELRISAYDPSNTEDMSSEDIAHLFRDLYDIRDMDTDGIVELVNKIYEINYVEDEYYLKDQQYIELSGLGIEAVRNIVHVDYASNLEEDFIKTYFVFKDKLYVVAMDRWENRFERVFPDEEIEIYDSLLQEIVEVEINNDNEDTDMDEEYDDE
jgi:hypothetical protein